MRDFVGDDLALLVTPFLDPLELTSAVSVCAAWRCRTACAVVDVGGAKPWLSGPFANALENDSFDLCRRAVNSTWFDQRHYVLALIVAVENGQDPLQRALHLLDKLPKFVPLPAEDLRDVQQIVPDGNPDGWVHTVLDACLENGIEVRMAQELRRQWASAYLCTEDDSDDKVRGQCADVLARWNGLWCCARCDYGTSVRSSSSLLRHPSLRGTEWWKADVLALGMATSEPSLLGSAHVAGSVAAVCFSYWEKRLMG